MTSMIQTQAPVRGARVAGNLAIIAGAILVIVGIVVWIVVATQLRAEAGRRPVAPPRGRAMSSRAGRRLPRRHPHRATRPPHRRTA